MLKKDTKEDIILLEQCIVVDNVCHGREGAPPEFFYMYVPLFTNLHVHFLFDDFSMGVF